MVLTQMVYCLVLFIAWDSSRSIQFSIGLLLEMLVFLNYFAIFIDNLFYLNLFTFYRFLYITFISICGTYGLIEISKVLKERLELLLSLFKKIFRRLFWRCQKPPVI